MVAGVSHTFYGLGIASHAFLRVEVFPTGAELTRLLITPLLYLIIRLCRF